METVSLPIVFLVMMSFGLKGFLSIAFPEAFQADAMLCVGQSFASFQCGNSAVRKALRMATTLSPRAGDKFTIGT